MWYEYVIITAGLILSAGFVLWMFLRSFRAKGNCCGSSCAPKQTNQADDRRLRATPIVQLNTSTHERNSQE